MGIAPGNQQRRDQQENPNAPKWIWLGVALHSGLIRHGFSLGFCASREIGLSRIGEENGGI
ncbi:MAG: hypothetical protein HC845_07075 [Akkermansiaceae bacterium]|nr:hypothetical protein [Akkermansiaceae bacterium]